MYFRGLCLMLIRCRCFISVVALVLVLSSVSMTAETRESTLLVIPARHTIMQLSLDIAGLRPVSLVAYEGNAASIDPLMHIWNGKTREWVRTGIEEYASADIFEIRPQRIILIGNDNDLPSLLIEASFWCADVKRIPTLNIMTLVNTLNESLEFTPREWKWLARRYKLKLKDLNAERRRYGRYGKPGEKRKVPMPRAVEPEAPLVLILPEPEEVKGIEIKGVPSGEPVEILPEDK